MAPKSCRCPLCGTPAPVPLGAMLRTAIGGLMRWDCPDCQSLLQFRFWPMIAGRALAFTPTLLLLALADFAGRFSGVLMAVAALLYLPLTLWVLRNLVPVEIVERHS